MLNPVSLVLNNVEVSSTVPLPVSISESIGSITWAAPVPITMTGASVAFVPASPTATAMKLWSASTNAAGAIDTAGGTVTLAASEPIFAGASPIVFTGSDVPTNAITAIGTNTNVFYYQLGT